MKDTNLYYFSVCIQNRFSEDRNNLNLVGTMLSGKKKLQNAAILLAFNRHVATDIERTKEMENFFAVYTVSRVEERGCKDHLHAHFLDLGKGDKSRILAFIREKVLHHKNVSVFLDYWWSAIGYFADAYGVSWLSRWVQAMLEAGAFEVFLPYCKEVQKMEKGLKVLVGTPIAKYKNPLWCATERAPGITSEFNAKKMLGLHGQTPFLRFRKGLHTNAFL
jgi:hypothetical protein